MHLASTFLVGCTLVLALANELPAGPASEDKTGLKLGTHGPEFSLQDQHGKIRSLADFLKKGKVALVFYRSADW